MAEEKPQPTPVSTVPTSGPFAALPKQLVICDNVSGNELEQLRSLRSHNVVVIRNSAKSHFIVAQNQRLTTVVMVGCTECKLSILDSAVVSSRTARLIRCSDCEVVIEDADVRKLELWSCTNCKLVVIGDEALAENFVILSHDGCERNVAVYGEMEPAMIAVAIRYKDVQVERIPPSVGGQRFATVFSPLQFVHTVQLASEQGQAALATLKPATLPALPGDDAFNAAPPADPAPILEALAKLGGASSAQPTKEQVDAAYDEERVEFEETPEAVMRKAEQVAALITKASYPIAYTGAGISTAADIPDFRGPTGAWTCRDKGIAPGGKDMEDASPTLAHFALTELARRALIRFVVTTNMDGLHVRSGLPRHLIEELHGGTYKEWCSKCGMFYHHAEPVSPGWGRLHETGNNCMWCDGKLQDTIVHFSDTYRDPTEPIVVNFHAKKADFALVLGTSMCVQPAASYPEKVLRNPNGQLVIVNLQQTPCDSLATVRVFAKTDVFMAALMQALKIQWFDTKYDARRDWEAEEQLLRVQMQSRRARAAKEFRLFQEAQKKKEKGKK